MPQSLDESVIRVLNAKGETVGTGFVVADHLAVTCAHVIKAAGGKPGATILIRFYLGKENMAAQVLTEAWSPVEMEDIAFFRLPSMPEYTRPLKLESANKAILHPYTSLGFPKQGDQIEARRPTDSINGLVPSRGRRDLLELKGEEMYYGMSGAPILDLAIDRVVGMVTMHKDEAYTRLVYATTTDTMQSYLSSLSFLMSDATAGNQNRINQSLDLLTRDYMAACAVQWSYIRAGLVDAPLEKVYTLLEVVELHTPTPLEHQPDLVSTPERLEHAGLSAKLVSPISSIPLAVVLKNVRHLVLLGEPGAGKSTTMQWIGLCFAQQHQTTILNLNELGVPVHVRLPEIAERICRSGARLFDTLVLKVKEQLPAEYGVTQARDALLGWMEAGGLVLLLDGLDEISEEQREEVRYKISGFLADPNGNRCRIILASRLAGYRQPLGDWRTFILKPFTRSEEALPYLIGWMGIFQNKKREHAEAEARNLLDQMNRNLALRQVSDNPLLLRLAAEVFVRTGTLARNRGDLYSRWVEEVVWQQRQGIDLSLRTDALRLLEDLAWDYQTHGPNYSQVVLSAEWKSLLNDKLGLIIRWQPEPGQERYAFSHATIREYFVARRLFAAWSDPVARRRAWKGLRPRLHDPAWCESLLLLAGQLSMSETTAIAKKVLAIGSWEEHILHRDLRMAAALLSQQATTNTFPRILYRYMHLLGRDLQNKNALLRAGAIDVLSNLVVSDEEMLKHALSDKDWVFRMMVILSLNKISGERAIDDLRLALDDEHSFVRAAAATLLGKVGDEQVVDDLRPFLKDKNTFVRVATTWALGQVGNIEVIDDLRIGLKDEYSSVRVAAVWALGRVGRDYVVDDLQDALTKDPLASVRAAAAWAIGQIYSGQEVDEQHATSSNKLENFRASMFRLLALFEDVRIVDNLQTVSIEKSAFVREMAVDEVRPYAKDQVVGNLRMALNDESSSVRAAAVWALGQVSKEKSVEDLRTALRDEDMYVRAAAARMLGNVDNEHVVVDLQTTLKDKSTVVREAAVLALAQIGNKQAVDGLRIALKDKAASVREAAVWALEQSGKEQALDDLRTEQRIIYRFEGRWIGSIIYNLFLYSFRLAFRLVTQFTKLLLIRSSPESEKDIATSIGLIKTIEDLNVKITLLATPPFANPLEESPGERHWHHIILGARITIVLTVLLVIYAILSFLLPSLQDVYKPIVSPIMQAYGNAHPIRLIAVTFGLILVGGLVGGLVSGLISIVLETLRGFFTKAK